MMNKRTTALSDINTMYFSVCHKYENGIVMIYRSNVQTAMLATSSKVVEIVKVSGVIDLQASIMISA
jgi:hypothetical protein